MSEFRVSKAHFVHLLLSDAVSVCLFVLSSPLYFCYFIFLLPYIVKLVAFLYPLIVMGLLVVVALCFDVVDEKFSSGSEGRGVGHLAVLYSSVVGKLRCGRNCGRNDEEEFDCLQDFGMYGMFFGSLDMEVKGHNLEVVEEEIPATQASDCSDHGGEKSNSITCPNLKNNPEVVDETPMEAPAMQASESSDHAGESKVGLNSITRTKLKNSFAGMEEKRLENFLKILDQFERMASSVEEKKSLPPLKCTKTNKVVEKPKAELPATNGSEATVDKVNLNVKISVRTSNGEKEDGSLVRAHSQRIVGSTIDHMNADDREINTWKVGNVDEDNGKNGTTVPRSGPLDRHSLGRYGSMRKEREWKRTLACKLFEERHSVVGGEGMDSLWEAYEMDSNKVTKPKSEKIRKSNKMKKEVECYSNNGEDQEEVDDDGAQLCCLQALKLSTAKMNLGMGRPNLVKIKKVINGFGWLHQVTKHSNSKKVHNNGDRYY